MADVEAPQVDTSVKKKFMFVNRKEPYGTIYALEALEVVRPGKRIITNLSTTALLEEIAAKHGGKVVRVPVGRVGGAPAGGDSSTRAAPGGDSARAPRPTAQR